MKKLLILPVLLLFFIPLALAEEEGCSLTNLPGCMIKKLFEFVLSILNAPLQPLLTLVKDLLSQSVAVSLFHGLWAVMVYVVSTLYGLLFLWAGLNFIISGHDVERREKAKTWFKNILIMVVLVQGSYFLYAIVIELAASLTQGVIGLINPNFFKLTATSGLDVALGIILLLPYVIVLLLTVIILLLRYVIVASGVIFLPIAIFLYFFEPLHEWGQAILNFLGTNIFATFFASLVLLAFSQITTIGSFTHFKIVLMITAFLAIDLIFLYFLLFALIRAAFRKISPTARMVSAVTKVR